MDSTELFNLRETFNDKDIMICFNGPFSRSIIEELGIAVRRHLEKQELAKSSLMDVFSVYIEQTQNIRNYAAGKDAPEGEKQLLNSGIVVIARDGERYVVSSGNLVEQTDVAPLVRQLETLRSLDKAGLKALYKEVMRKPRSAAGNDSAGLGLIDMARKASGPLEYSVKPVAGRRAFFSLRAVL